MKLFPRLLITFTAAALVASCASPPTPLPPAPVPPAAPPPPPVALSRSVLQAASAYRLYMKRAGDISPAFADGSAVEESLASGVAFEPKQLLRGAIAYAALVALQSPQFVAGVRTYAVDPVQRRDLGNRLISDPNYASALPSATSAAGLIAATLQLDAAKVRRAGEAVKQAAYDVQHQAWSKGDVPGRDLRLANAKALSSQPVVADEADLRVLARAVNGRDAAGVSALNVSGEMLAPPYTAVISRGLALAALAALGEAGEANDAALQGLMDDSASAFCLNMGKLNTYQCLSVSKPYYEDVFCLGQHVLMDTAQCIQKAAGAPQPVTVAETVTPRATPAAPTGKASSSRAKRRGGAGR